MGGEQSKGGLDGRGHVIQLPADLVADGVWPVGCGETGRLGGIRGGQGCHSLEQLERGEIRGALAAGSRARFYGLVPDGVAQIRVRRQGAAPTDIDVRDNFYDFTLRSSGQDEPIAVQSLEWLGDDRTVTHARTPLARNASATRERALRRPCPRRWTSLVEELEARPC
jgi:hypothetical protein